MLGVDKATFTWLVLFFLSLLVCLHSSASSVPNAFRGRCGVSSAAPTCLAGETEGAWKFVAITSKLVALPREAYGRTLPFLATTTLARGLMEWLAA